MVVTASYDIGMYANWKIALAIAHGVQGQRSGKKLSHNVENKYDEIFILYMGFV